MVGNVTTGLVWSPGDQGAAPRCIASNIGALHHVQAREPADRAKAELNGVILHDLELKIGWGKAVQIPPAPMYTAASVFATPGGGPAGGPKGPGAAVPPPGVDAAPPWVAPVHGGDGRAEGVGACALKSCLQPAHAHM